MTPAQQREFGIAAVIAAVAMAARWAPHGFDAAGEVANEILEGFVWEHFVPAPDHVDGPLVIPLPDLAAIGVQACAACGCTETHSCPGEHPCGWATQDLCTNCVPDAAGLSAT